jgi:hypothetical protein
MKRILFMAMISGLLFASRANAQVRVSINIGSQPAWAPVGYDNAQYYYMPDIDAYYDVAAGQYVYFQDGRWVFAGALPPAFHYDIYRGYKVAVNEPRPWLHADAYRNRYAQYRGMYDRQPIIRDSHDVRYAAVRDHDNRYDHNFDNRDDRGHDRDRRGRF